MAKRGYKLQEFVAHSGAVKCVNIGKKACRLLITGGEDHKVNLWAIGNPSSLTSLCGHTSPIESVVFDSSEGLVVAGASTGVIKLWALEEAKMVRTLTGHRSNCTSVEFHPFGEFFASGSLDTNLRIWDIRKKGCIHTYKGHTQGVSAIRFTPDGRWVVSGGFDNVVKVWDLTAGKLLHDFKFHEGHIRSLDFHPLEFLLATGSADRTVKFWDLETFELIGSTRPEATAVHSITFHPDGRTLFSGMDDSLKVYSWEPVVRHDSVDMGWSTLGDLCIREGKLMGCSYYQNSVGVWVADISHIEPYGAGFGPAQYDCVEKKESSSEKVGNKSTSVLCNTSPDYESKEIKNIYIDCSGGNFVTSQKIRSSTAPKEAIGLRLQKQTPASKINGQATNKNYVVPSIVPRESSDGKELVKSKSVTTSRGSTGILSKPAQMRRLSHGKLESGFVGNLNSAMDQNFRRRLEPEAEANEYCEEKGSDIKTVAEKFEKVLSPKTPKDQGNSDEPLGCNKGAGSVVSGGLPLFPGRTRTLVERFERRERVNPDKDHQSRSSSPPVLLQTLNTFPTMDNQPQASGRPLTPANDETVIEELMQNHDVFLSTLRSRLTKLQVVRHFWERNDTKGAISAMRKLPDHSVQADVVSVLMERMDVLTLDLFSSFLPMLIGLLDSKIERHAKLSLDMLLKLVAVFGSVIRATVSAPAVVGVDLHQEQRREWCNQCFIQLQKIQKILPTLVRRGGLLSKSALELNLVLQES